MTAARGGRKGAASGTVHEALRVTPATALGVSDHIWTIGELVGAALEPETVPPRFAPFAVVRGRRT